MQLCIGFVYLIFIGIVIGLDLLIQLCGACQQKRVTIRINSSQFADYSQITRNNNTLLPKTI